MATYYTLLTKIGQASVANAVALNQKVNLTYMAVGDGNGNPTTPNENQTALVREKYRAQINQLTVDADNPNYIIAEMVVPTTVGGWSIYEVGVFNDQGQLVAVANFPATYKPELAEGSGRDLIVRIVIQVSNTSVVTLKIDPAITLASQAWVAANYVKKVTVAGGTTGQVLVKKSNANEDFQWVDPTAAVDVNVFSREETQTLAANQTIVNLAQLTTDGAALYVEGVRLRDNQFTVNTATRLTLATAYPAGTRVTIVQNEETSRNAFTLKANNLSDLADKAAARTNLGLAAAALLGVATEEQMKDGTSELLLPSVKAVMSLLPKRNFSIPGFIRIPDVPGGLVIQWGNYVTTNSTQDVNLPFTYSVAQVACVATYNGPATIFGFITAQAKNTSQVTLHGRTMSGNPTPGTFYVISIGF